MVCTPRRADRRGGGVASGSASTRPLGTCGNASAMTSAPSTTTTVPDPISQDDSDTRLVWIGGTPWLVTGPGLGDGTVGRAVARSPTPGFAAAVPGWLSAIVPARL